MKKVIVLPGSDFQIPLVKEVKCLGYEVTVISPNEDSPAFRFADHFECADILDRQTCLRIAQRLNIDAVLTDECDIAMPTVGYISDNLGLNSLGLKNASLYTNKSLMRDFCVTHNLDTPEYQLCTTIEEAKQFFAQINAKCIIKPLDGNSSRGVFTIESVHEIEKYFHDALLFSKCASAVIIERYVEGTEFTIDGIVTDHGHKSLAISEKKHYEHNKNIAYQLFFSHHNERFNYNVLRETNDKFVNISDLAVGCFTHAEYKFRDGKFYLIEIGARGGGNFISSDIVPIMTGFNNYQYYIDAMLGNEKKPLIIDNENNNRCAVLYFFDTPNIGIVKEIKGLDFIENCPGIVRYKLNFKIGDKIEKAANDSSRIGFYIAYAENEQNLISLMNEINDHFKLIII